MRGYWDDPPEPPPCVTDFKRRRVAKTRKPYKCGFCGHDQPAGRPSYVFPFKDYECSPPKFGQYRTCSPQGECCDPPPEPEAPWY